ncbi:MAG: right-handed parallel beta-helix repeat-containing protein [Candidatus Thermoplasmatota archaeon]|nr:right-handed parallel beta-helix repeat-containing protein [Candidatus Thermoplasmatota archaeon]
MNKSTIAVGASVILLLSVAGVNFSEIIGGTRGQDDSYDDAAELKGNIITVDNEGDGDYLSIKEAVTNANPGDIIEVYSGDYYECNITITNPNLTLKGIPYELGIGNDTGKPFIHGQGLNTVMIIKADDVILTGFSMENSGTSYAHGIISICSCNNCLVSDNGFSHSVMSCIGCINSSNTKIIGNNISHSIIRHGITLHDSNNNTVANNTITDMGSEGICIWSSDYNTITGNKISRCKGYGIDLPGGDHNTVVQNSFEDNHVGVFLDGYHNLIAKNNFIDNEENAFILYLLPLKFPFCNIWLRNYWDDWTGIGPYVIRGRILYVIPWIGIDPFPAFRPYDIDGNKEINGTNETGLNTNLHIQGKEACKLSMQSKIL